MIAMTRRLLLQSLAAGAAPVSFGRKIRVAFIGNEGHVGEITKPLNTVPEIEIVAADRADPKLRAKKTYKNWREMLDSEKDLDVVAVTNDNGGRAEAIIACAQRKLNVIAEKPLALTREDLARVRDAVQTNGISLGMLLTMRYEPPYLAMRERMLAGEVGDVLQMSSQKSYKLGNRAEWFKSRRTYGGTIAWIGIHMIDLMRHIGGREFVEAASFQTRVGFPQFREMETVTTSMFRLDNGGLAELHMDYLRPESASTHGDDRLRIAGTKGVLEWQQSTGLVLQTQAGKPTTITSLPQHGELFLDYLRATYSGGKPSITVDDMFRVTEITIAAQQAADLGRIVKI